MMETKTVPSPLTPVAFACPGPSFPDAAWLGPQTETGPHAFLRKAGENGLLLWLKSARSSRASSGARHDELHSRAAGDMVQRKGSLAHVAGHNRFEDGKDHEDSR